MGPAARWVRLLLALGAWLAALSCAAAIDPQLLKRLPDGDNDEKVAVIRAIAASGEADAAAVLKQMAAGDLKVENDVLTIVGAASRLSARALPWTLPVSSKRID